MSASAIGQGGALRLVRAVAAVPPARLWARLVHEAGRRAAESLPRAWRERLADVDQPPPAVRSGYLAALARELGPGEASASLTVDLLGRPHVLERPIDWEPAGRARLWHFTLHYFDWAVAAVASADDPAPAARAVFDAMGSWASAVPFGRYDAWHPYPTAKRLVSWTYLLATFPELVTPELDRSHWLQVRYLAQHPERHAGGNHLLQDLCALVVAGLRYRGDAAEEVVARALHELCREAPRQVTADGCHHELSAAYHLQVVVMLAEAVLSLASAGLASPPALLGALAATTAFAERMRLPDGSYPLWSDSSRDSVAPLDVVVALARGALAAATGSGTASSGGAVLPYPYAQLLASAAAGKGLKRLDGAPSRPFRTLARASGYHVLRGDGLTAVFDGADTGARGLPGHGHADCLNVDVHTAAGPLIVESGTSTYDPGDDRDRERGTAAHNTVEVEGLDQTEVWGSFRTGRPARTFDRAAGESGGWSWASAAHDGYVHRGVTHRRWVGVRGGTVAVLDALELAAGAPPATFRLRFHLAPGVEAREEEGAIALGLAGSETWLRIAGLAEGEAVGLVPAADAASFHAERFGHRRPRGLVEVTGTLSPGRRYLGAVLSPRRSRAELRHAAGAVELVTDLWPTLAWRDAPGPLVPVPAREEAAA